MKYKKYFSEYLDRSKNLLQSDDEVNLIYCALELRKAIELVIWAQFTDAFRNEWPKLGITYYEIIEKFQNESIFKMYELLKTHISHYSNPYSSSKTYKIHTHSYGGPKIIDGETCNIPPELPTSDYKYLSALLHYEKELPSKKYKIDKGKLNQIYKRLVFVKKHHTLRFLPIDKDKKDVVANLKKEFNIK